MNYEFLFSKDGISKAAYLNTVWISSRLTNSLFLKYEITSETNPLGTVHFLSLYCPCLIAIFKDRTNLLECRIPSSSCTLLVSNLAPEFFVEVVVFAFHYFSECSVNCRANSLSISSNTLRALIPLSVILNIFSSLSNSISLC